MHSIERIDFMKTRLKKKSGGILSRNSYSLMSAVIAAVIMLFVYAVWEFFPFGSNIILRMDLYHQYAPLFAELYERVFGGDTLLYSFTSGLGSGFLGNYFNYLSSPTLLFVLIFGHYNVPEAVAAMVLFKASASAYTFSYFLNKYTGKRNMASVAFGILYAFCGYFVAYYWNVMWLDAMVMFPIVILGVYYIIEKGRSLPYVLSLAYIMITNYYMAYMVCILSVIFFLYLYFSTRKLSDKLYPQVILKDKYKKTLKTRILNSTFIMRGVTFAAASLLAAMIAAVALLPVYYILQNSSATSSSFPSSFSTYFSIFDFLANHLAGVEPTIRSSGDTVYPNVYCGIITLVLVPLFLYSKKFSIKEKIATTGVLGVFFLSFNVNMLNFVWHGFHFPNDLPYRFSFAYSFFLLFIAYRVLTNIEQVSSKAILSSAIGVVMFTVFVEEIGSANVDMGVVWTSVAFAVVYAVILAFIKNPKYSKPAISVLLITAVCAEILIADTGNYKVTQTKSSYTSSYEDTEAAIDIIEDLESDGDDDSGFYRMELATLLTRMDNCWFYYNGVSTFTSMAYEDVAHLQNYLGLYGNKINSYTYNCQTGLYNSMLSIKYIVDNHSYVSTDRYIPQLDGNFLYEEVGTYNDMTIYENKYWLPIAFSVDENTDTDWNYDLDNPFEVQNDFYYNASGVADILTPLNGTVSDSSNIDPISDGNVNSGIFNVYKEDTSSNSNEITISYDCDKTQDVYAYIECSSVSSVLITAGSVSYTQDISSSSYVLDLGEVPEGTVVTVTFSLDDDTISGQVELYIYGLDEEKFIEAYNNINESGVLDVTENTDSYIKGTIDLAEDKMLYTSIPYDKGWSVYVDGVEVADEDIVKIGDALMGVKMEAGEHTVEFKFVPQGLVVGGACTVIGVAILIILLILKKKKKLMFSSGYKAEVLELGRWRDTGAEAEIKEQELLEEERISELIKENQEDMEAEEDDLWSAALAEAENYAKTVTQTPEETQQQLEEFEKIGAEAARPDEENEEPALEPIATGEELEEFEKATESFENIQRKPKTEAEDKKKAQKKRLNLAVFVIILVICVAAAAGIMIYAITNGENETEPAALGTVAEAITEAEDETEGDTETEPTTTVTTQATTASTTAEATTAEPTTQATTATTVTTAATTSAPTTEYTGAYITYTVQSGDNFYSILRDHDIADTAENVQKLCDINGISVSTVLAVGQVIKIPTE